MLVAMLRRLQPVAQLASRVVSQQANLTQARRQHARVFSSGVRTHICLRSYAAAFALRSVRISKTHCRVGFPLFRATRRRADTFCIPVLRTLQVTPATRCLHVSAAARGGAGTPVTQAAPVTSEVAEEAELTWDDGTLHPEPCLDDPAPRLTAGQGASYLAASLGVFYFVYLTARVNNKKDRVPFAPRVWPYDGLKQELGRA